MLAHPDLKIAIRKDTLDVYHWGASIFRVALQDGRVAARTHFKYLVRQRQGHASLVDGRFVHEAGKALWAEYEGRKTLDEMITATKPLAGAEKAGLHPLIMYPRVIDLEIAFRNAADSDLVPHLPDEVIIGGNPGETPTGANASPGTKLRKHRLDAATLEDRDGKLWVVFHEAKEFTNAELRAAPSRPPPITEQVARYRRAIEHHADDIKTSYHQVSKALRELDAMRTKSGSTSHWDELIRRAADGETLHIDIEPRLIVFGFDVDQKKGSIWRQHRERLEEAMLSVHTVGKPTRKSGAAAFARKVT